MFRLNNCAGAGSGVQTTRRGWVKLAFPAAPSVHFAYLRVAVPPKNRPILLRSLRESYGAGVS